MRSARLLSLAAAALLAGLPMIVLGGCSKASDEADSKRAPEPPPPGPPRLPESWQLEVQLDGETLEPLTAAKVNAVKPDFMDSERRGWRIETLVPRAANATRVIADSAAGVSVMYEMPDGGEGHAAGSSGAMSPPLPPALFLTRRGELIVASLDPGNPFPRYHGKGGQLRRVGDSQPRLLGVTRLRIFHGKATL